MQTRSKVLIAVLIIAALLSVAGAVVRDITVDIAHDNLSNADFGRAHWTTPWALGLPHENVTFEAADGVRTAGWYVPADNATATVVLVHGLGAEMGKVLHRWGPNLHDAGYALVTVDLRNHGASPDAGHITYGTREALDVRAAVAWARSHVGPDVRLYGSSMGAATVLLAAAAEQADGTPVQGVIADSPYASFAFQAHYKGAADGYPGFLVDMVIDHMDRATGGAVSHADPETAIQGLTAPLLLMHCDNDVRIDIASQGRLAAAAPHAQVWHADCPAVISSEHHVEGWLVEGYNGTVQGFLS